MKNILILILICTCLTTLGFGLIAWKLYPCPCSYLSSRNRTLHYGTSRTTGVAKGYTTGTVKGSTMGTSKSSYSRIPDEYTVIILSRTGRVIDIRRCTE